MGTVNVQQYVNRMERIGGASGSDTDTDTVQYIDDTVQTQNADTDLASQTLQTQDSGVVQAQDTQDTQDNWTHIDKHNRYSYPSYLFAIILLIFIYHVFNIK